MQVSEIADLVNATKSKYRTGKASLTLKYPKYEFCNTFLAKEDDLFEGVDGGKDYNWDVNIGSAGQAEEVDLYEEGDITIQDVLVQATMPWRFTRTHWGFDENEAAINSGPEKIVDVIKQRRLASILDWADRQEENAWTVLLSTETKKPYNFPYYVPYLDDAQAGEGFYGGAPTGFAAASACAGIAAATSGDNTDAITGGTARWRSYAAGGAGYYTAVDTTWLNTIKTALRKTSFQSPILPTDIEKIEVAKYRIYTNNVCLNAFEELARQQNDQVGSDLAAFMGRAAIRNIIPRYVPVLDADTRNPWYGINLNDFQVKALKRSWFTEKDAMPVSARTPSSYVVWIMANWNLACLNRRGSFVIRKTA